MEEEKMIHAPETLLPTLLRRLHLSDEASVDEEKVGQINGAGWQARVQAIHAMREERDKDELMAAFSDPDEAVRLAALQVCADWDKHAPLQQVIACLHDSSALVRQAAVFALASLDHELARQYIRDAQFDPSPMVHDTALQMLTRSASLGGIVMDNETTIPIVKSQTVQESDEKVDPSPTEEPGRVSLKMESLETDNRGVEIVPLEGRARQNPVSRRRRRWSRFIGAAAAILIFGLLGSWLTMMYLPGLQVANYGRTPLWAYSNPIISNSIAWSTDGSQLSFLSQQNMLSIYNLTTRKLTNYPTYIPLQGQANKNEATVSSNSPDGRYLVTVASNKAGGTGQMSIWDNKTGLLAAKAPYYQPSGQQQTNGSYYFATPQIAWSENESQMAVIDGRGNLIVWHTQVGQEPFLLKSNHGTFEKVAWSQDNKTLVASTISGQLEIWNSLTCTMVGSATVGTAAQEISLSPDAHYAAAVDVSSTMSIVDVQSSKVIDSQDGIIPFEKDGNLSWSKDSHYLLLFSGQAGNADVTGTIVWDVAQHRKVLDVPSSSQASSAFSPDGHYVAVATPDKQQIGIWDIRTGRQVATHKGKMGPNSFTIAWSPDGRYIASVTQDRQVQMWDAQNGQDVVNYNQLNGDVQSILWSPTGTVIAISTAERRDVSPSGYRLSNFNLTLWSAPSKA